MAPPQVPEGCPLKPRQLEVLQMLADGATVEDVAWMLELKPSTVWNYAQRGYRRLGARSPHHAMAILARNGWLDWKPPASTAAPRTALDRLTEHFQRWVDSGFSDLEAHDAFRSAAGTACAEAGVQPSGRAKSSAMRDLLQHVANGDHTDSKGT